MGRAQGLKDLFTTVLGDKRGNDDPFYGLDKIGGTDYEKLKKAFVELRKHGFSAKICTTQAIRDNWRPSEKTMGYLATSATEESFARHKVLFRGSQILPPQLEELERPLYVYFDQQNDVITEEEVAAQTVRILLRAGLAASWSGNKKEAIVVKPL